MKRVISYASRGLNKAEKNYPPHKREFLALKFSICDKFKDYLYGQRFTVLTDNNPVTYVLTTAKLDATGHRWLTALSTFNFDIKYRPGKINADADALSRLPAVHDSEGCTITSESVQAICESMIPKSYVESLAVSPEIVEEDLAATYVGDLVDWTRVQALDSNIRQCIEYLQANKKPHKKETGHNSMIREYNRMKLINKFLYRITTIEDEERKQLVLPAAHIPTVLQALHDDMGHPGKDRTLSLLRDRFYWPGMYKDTESWIEQCGRCLRRKTPTN
jgi:hypothetical protein